MDDIFVVRHVECRSNDCGSCAAMADFVAGCLKLCRPGCPEDRSAYTAALQQGTVCSIDNRIGFQFCDIVLMDFNTPDRGERCFVIHNSEIPFFLLIPQSHYPALPFIILIIIVLS